MDHHADQIARLQAEAAMLRAALAALAAMPAAQAPLHAQLEEKLALLGRLQQLLPSPAPAASPSAGLPILSTAENRGTVYGSMIGLSTGPITNITLDAVTGLRDLQDSLRAIHAAVLALPGRQFDAYQQVAAGLGRASIALDVDSAGRLHLRTDATQVAPVDLRPFQDLLLGLRDAILGPRQVSSAELELRRTRFLELMIDQCHALRLEGLSSGTRPIILALEEVYVHLRVVAEVPETADAFSPEERRLLEDEPSASPADPRVARRERGARERMERFPIAQALADPHRRGLVILGDPGSGKSTLLQFLALCFARGPAAVERQLQVCGADAARLPILAPLASYDDMLNEQPELTVQEFLARYYDRRRAAPGLGPIFDAAITEGHALILLDGLDEVIDEGRRRFVAEQVTRFVQSALARGNRVVLTSRVYGYRAAPLMADLPHFTVLDFRQEEISIFARQWFRALARWEHAGQLSPQLELLVLQEERRLLEEIRSNPGVERLAVNPLLLTMLALLRRQIGTLPQRRIRLYDQYVSALIESWEQNRNRGARLHGVAPRVDLKEAEGVLIELALWLQQERPSGTATADDLLARVAACYLWQEHGLRPGADAVNPALLHQAEERARRFLHDMRQHAGLLIERGQNAFGFRHLTFQEYFAGRALARMPAEERWALIEPNLHGGRWREPLLLCAARLGVSESRDGEAGALIERVLGTGSEYEELLHRDLFLAADCAADDIGLSLPLLRRIAARLWALLDAPVPGLVIAALRRLQQLALLRTGGGAALRDLQLRLFQVLLERVRQTPPFGMDPVAEQARALLRHMPPQQASELRATLLACLDDESWDVRDVALGVLGPLAGHDPRVRAALLDRLGDERVDVQQALAPLAELDQEVRDVLLACLSSLRWDVRAASIEALGPLARRDTPVRTALLFSLLDARWEVRAAALAALGPLARDDRYVRQAMLLCLNDTQRDVRAAALVALGPLAADDPQVRTDLLNSHCRDAWNVQVPDGQLRALAFDGMLAALVPLVPREAAVRMTLLGLLRDPRGDVRAAVAGALGPLAADDAQVRVALLRHLADESWNVRVAVVGVLGPLAAGDAEVRTALLRRLDDEWWEVRSAAISGLSAVLGHERGVAQAIRRMLDHDDWRTRRATLTALAPALNEHPGLAALVAIQMHKMHCYESAPSRLVLLEVLACLVAESPAVRRVMLAHLESGAWRERAAALRALGVVVGCDPEVRAALLRRLDDEWWEVRAAALSLLRPLVGADARVRAALLTRLGDPRWNIQAAAIHALGPHADHPQVCAALLARLDDESSEVRVTLVQVLSPHAGDAAVRAALLARLDDEWWDVQTAATRALGPLARDDAAVRAALLARLDDPERWDLRAAAVEALGPLARDDAAVRAALLARLDDPDRDVWMLALELLGPLADADTQVRAALLNRLRSPRWELHAAALAQVRPLAKHDREVRLVLLDCLGDQRWDLRAAALAALSPLVRNDAEVRLALLACLDDARWEMRAAVLEALAPLAGHDRHVCTALLACLEDGDNAVRAAATAALGPLAGQSRLVYAAMMSCLDDPAQNVRAAALRAFHVLAPADGRARLVLQARLDGLPRSQRLVTLQVLGELATDDAAVRATLLAHLCQDADLCAAALRALAPLAAGDAQVRAALLARAADPHGEVRLAAVCALGPLAASDAAVRVALLACLSDPWREIQLAALPPLAALAGTDPHVRAVLLEALAAAPADWRVEVIRALAPALAHDPALRAAVVVCLEDPLVVVRLAALASLLPLIEGQPTLYERLLDSVGRTDALAAIRAGGQHPPSDMLDATLRLLVDAYGQSIQRHTQRRAQAIALLTDPDWRRRNAAAHMLAAAGPAALQAALPQILVALDDWRGLDAWPARLEAAALLINHERYSAAALEQIQQALTYGAEAILPIPRAREVRLQAAQILGKLKTHRHRQRAAARVAALLRNERDPQVLDGLHDALAALVAPEPEAA